MIAEKATESINQAVVYELQNIVKKYGAVYNSEHEGYAVLLEEVDEAGDALADVEKKLTDIWLAIKANELKLFDIHLCNEFALALAEEAVQVAAVCERFEATVGSK